VSGHLTIRRIRSEYRVARDTADPLRIRDACDAALRQHLPPVLRSAFGRWCDGDDESVWLVRRLDIDLAIGADWKSDQLSGAFTARIARGLARVLVGDGDGINAIRFAGPATHLARFLADAATGDAWSRWYYGRFEGLSALCTSAALRTALLEDPRIGLSAMQRLSDPEIARVVTAMSAHDRGVVLDRFAEVTAGAEASSFGESVRTAWSRCASAFPDPLGRALAVFVRAQCAGCGGPALRSAIDGLSTARVLTPPEPHAAHREMLEKIFTARETDVSAPDWTASTPYGGVFFLLPQLDELPLEDWLESWPAPAGAAPGSAMRLLVAAKCLGAGSAQVAFHDAVLRALLHIGPDFTLASAGAWLRRVGPERRRSLLRAAKAEAKMERVDLRSPAEERARLAFPPHVRIARAWDDALYAIAQLALRRFARRLPGFARSGFVHLHRNFLDAVATLEAEFERLVARVARPPLYLVLNLTGMTRTSYTIRGEPRPIAVFAQE